MIQPTYPAARLVADAVQGHFARHIGAARAADSSIARTRRHRWRSRRSSMRRSGRACAAKKDRRRRSRSRSCRPSRRAIRCCSRRSCRSRRRCCRRSRPRSSGPASISACGATGDDFHVWGTTREVPAFCLVVEVVASGLIVVKHRYEPFGKFVNVAVLEGDQIKIVDEGVGRIIPDCPAWCRRWPARSITSRRPASPRC